MSVGRTTAAALGGVVVAGLTIAAVEAAGHAAVGTDAVFGAAAVGYGLGALTGTAVAATIAPGRADVAVPVILAGLAVANLVSFPHPVWFVPAALLALGVGWWLGRGIVARRAGTRTP